MVLSETYTTHTYIHTHAHTQNVNTCLVCIIVRTNIICVYTTFTRGSILCFEQVFINMKVLR